MGNRGTTPSWDEEEIAKHGFDLHMSSLRVNRLSIAHREQKLREKLIAQLKQLLQLKQGRREE